MKQLDREILTEKVSKIISLISTNNDQIHENFMNDLKSYIVTALHATNSTKEYLIDENSNRAILFPGMDARYSLVRKSVQQLSNRLEMKLVSTAREHFVESTDNCSIDQNCNPRNISLNSIHMLSQNISDHTTFVSSTRWSRATATAVIGGAMLSISLGLAGPQLIASISTTLGASNSIGQMLLTLQSLVSVDRLAGLGFAGALGALWSGFKSLKQTAQIDEFKLDPLHYPSVQEQDSSLEHESKENLSHSYLTVNVQSPIEIYNDEGQEDPLIMLISGLSHPQTDEWVNWGADRVTSAADILRSTDELVAVDAQGEDTVSTNDTNTRKFLSSDEQHSVDEFRLEVTDDDERSWVNLSHSDKGWFRELFPRGQSFLVVWATECLRQLTCCSKNFWKNQVPSIVNTLVNTLVNITQISYLITVLKRLNDLDEPWATALDRSAQAGKLLAHLLKRRYVIAKQLHHEDVVLKSGGASSSSAYLVTDTKCNPVTLIGYGLGARVVFECLHALSVDTEEDLSGIVENAVLLGAPVGFGSVDFSSGLGLFSGHYNKWRAVRKVVNRRLVNCYCTTDWFLALLFRSKTFEVSIAGIQPVLNSANEQGLTNTHNERTTNLSSNDSFHAICNCSTQSLKVLPCDDTNSSCLSINEIHQRYCEKTSTACKIVDQWYKDLMKQTCEVENVDVSDLVKGMMDYPGALRPILTRINIEG